MYKKKRSLIPLKSFENQILNESRTETRCPTSGLNNFTLYIYHESYERCKMATGVNRWFVSCLTRIGIYIYIGSDVLQRLSYYTLTRTVYNKHEHITATSICVSINTSCLEDTANSSRSEGDTRFLYDGIHQLEIRDEKKIKTYSPISSSNNRSARAKISHFSEIRRRENVHVSTACRKVVWT